MSTQYVTINFGPENKYVLSLPVTAQNRVELEEQFKKAAKVAAKPLIKKSKSIKQLVFDFCGK